MPRQSEKAKSLMLERGFISVSVAAEAAMVSRKTVYQWADDGEIISERGGDILYVEVRSILRLFSSKIFRENFGKVLREKYGNSAIKPLSEALKTL